MHTQGFSTKFEFNQNKNNANAGANNYYKSLASMPYSIPTRASPSACQRLVSDFEQKTMEDFEKEC